MVSYIFRTFADDKLILFLFFYLCSTETQCSKLTNEKPALKLSTISAGLRWKSIFPNATICHRTFNHREYTFIHSVCCVKTVSGRRCLDRVDLNYTHDFRPFPGIVHCSLRDPSEIQFRFIAIKSVGPRPLCGIKTDTIHDCWIRSRLRERDRWNARFALESIKTGQKPVPLRITYDKTRSFTESFGAATYIIFISLS